MAFFGYLGFVFAIIAYSEVFALKKRVAQLESARGTTPQ